MIFKISSEKIKEFIEKQHAIDGMVSIHDFELWLEEQPKVGEWIPCSERLPECEWGAETEALMYQVGDTIYTGHFGRDGLWRDEYFRRYADIKEGVDASDVIAWMPLPEPYEKEGAE